MSCYHTNVYGNPPPAKGENAWCPRCEEFRTVIVSQKIEAIPDKPIGYTKTNHPTPYTNHVYYPLRPSHWKHFGYLS